jgi:hypothetical protein
MMGVMVHLGTDSENLGAVYYPVARLQSPICAHLEARYDISSTPLAYTIEETVILLYDLNETSRWRACLFPAVHLKVAG